MMIGVMAAWVLFPFYAVFAAVFSHPICPNCQYDLYGSASDTCPECGAEVRGLRQGDPSD